MTDEVPDEPARLVLERVLRPLLPEGWQLVSDEHVPDDTNQTRVVLSQRTVQRLTAAGTGVHAIGYTVTVSVPGVEMTAAERRLDDELDAFLWAVDRAGYVWTTATKAIYDGRLGYQLEMTMTTTRKAD